MKTGWKYFWISVVSFITGFLLTLLNSRQTKETAALVADHEVRQKNLFAENKEVKRAIKTIKKDIEKQNREELKRNILDNFT